MADRKENIVCGWCKEIVKSEEDYIICDGNCRSSLHRTCAKLNKKDFKRLLADKSKKWYCGNCDESESQSETPCCPIPNDMTQVIREIHMKLSKLESIEVEQNEIKKSVTFCADTFDDVKCQLTKITEDLKRAMGEITKLQTKVATLEKQKTLAEDEVTKLRVENQDLQQYVRRNNLEIHGIPHVNNENPVEIAKSLGKALGVEVCDSDIDACHRLPQKKMEFPPPLLIKFCSRLKKDQLLSAKKIGDRISSKDVGIPAPDRSVYINEHLTPNNKYLHKLARDLRKCGFKYVWTRECKIYVRKSDNQRAIRITSVEDVKRLQSETRSL